MRDGEVRDRIGGGVLQSNKTKGYRNGSLNAEEALR